MLLVHVAVVLQVVQPSCSSSSAMVRFLADFCKNIGKSHVTITSLSHSNFSAISDLVHLSSALNRNSVFARSVPIYELKAVHKISLDTVLFLENNIRTKSSQIIFDHLAETKVKSVVLALVNHVSPFSLQAMLSNFRKNSVAYLVHPKERPLSGNVSGVNNLWSASSILTLNNEAKVIIHSMSRNQVGQWVEEAPNLQGLHVTCTNMPWSPLFDFKDCNSTLDNCTSTGYVADYMDMMGGMLNFTWSCVKDNHEGDWGMEPANGIRNISHGEWKGAMGSIWWVPMLGYGLIDEVASWTLLSAFPANQPWQLFQNSLNLTSNSTLGHSEWIHGMDVCSHWA